MTREGDDQDDVEKWVPLTRREEGHKDVGRTGEPLARPGKGQHGEEMLRQFFEMEKIPADTEVVVAPSMRAAIDVPLKVLVALLFVFGPFTATGLFVGPPVRLQPLVVVYTIMQYWPILLFVFYPALRLRFTRYIVDAEGIRTRTQLLSVSEERISWNKVTAIGYRRTLIDRILGLERLNIIAYGERGATIRMIGLRDAKRLRDLTAQKMREHATAESIFSND